MDRVHRKIFGAIHVWNFGNRQTNGRTWNSCLKCLWKPFLKNYTQKSNQKCFRKNDRNTALIDFITPVYPRFYHVVSPSEVFISCSVDQLSILSVLIYIHSLRRNYRFLVGGAPKTNIHLFIHSSFIAQITPEPGDTPAGLPEETPNQIWKNTL